MAEKFHFKYDDLFDPTVKALRALGGSASVPELEEGIAEILKLSEGQINEIHSGSRTKLSYRSAWARRYLKRYGLVENSSRGVWSLTNAGLKIKVVDKEAIRRKVVSDDREAWTSKLKGAETVQEIEAEDNEEIQRFTWQEEIIEKLQSISPSAFERLCQRLLRELGFQNVEVTGKANDGGIDGKGLLKIGGVLSFHVIFQAKRYKGTVSPSVVRDFRGAMVGKADKGLIITTGTFTANAKAEARRDGPTPIDLIDGNELAEKLKELRLGVEIEMVEKITVKNEWFKAI